MGNPRFTFSWYLFSDQPHQLLIGPAGHGEGSWHELGPVLTPEDRWGNGFYMDAECRCVMNFNQLVMVYNPAHCCTGSIYYGNICYQVPGLEQKYDMDLVTPAYLQWFDERRKEYQQLMKRKK